MTETELLFSEVLNCDRLSLYLNRGIVLDKDKMAFVSSVLKRRIKNEPIQYILGKTEFMGLDFKITKDVLIPRQETEILVEAAIKFGSRLSGFGSRLRILDIGTGSGCIAVSLAKFLPCAKITAIDISEKAIDIAKQNASSNNVNINFLVSDLFANYELRAMPAVSGSASGGSYDLIISNPPYVPNKDIRLLQPEIGYEPRIALDGGKDGLDFYRKIIKQAPDYLKDKAFLIMEMGYAQAPKIKNILQNSGNFEIIEVVNDYSNIERAIIARKLAVSL